MKAITDKLLSLGIVNQNSHEAEQAWKGSVKRGFKFIRLSKNFANRSLTQMNADG